VILAGLPRLAHFSLAQLGFRLIGLRAIGYGVSGAVAWSSLGTSAEPSSKSLTHSTHEELAIHIFENIRHNTRLVIFFAIFAVVLQPFVEEMLFRVFLFKPRVALQRLLDRRDRERRALRSHAPRHRVCRTSRPPPLLALGGVILAWVYYRSRNAYASMISHALFNGLSTAALYFAPKLIGS